MTGMIENLQSKISTLEWLTPTNIHNNFFIKLIFLFVDKFLILISSIFFFQF